MRPTLLATNIIEHRLAGQQPAWLMWLWLKQHRLAEDWTAQRRFFNPELEDDGHAHEVLR